MLTIGKILDGRYYIREQIGDGGYGAVYLAQDSRFSGNNLVAVKKIPQTSEHHNKSFRREADLLYNLGHPNLPKVSNCFQEDGANFIVMDYISGEDLAVSLRKGKQFSISEVFQIADKVLDALEYLHSSTIFHRDIKPHNIKIDANGKIYLLDFGTAKGNFDEVTVTRQQGQSITGYTPFYAPLEQVLRIDPNSYFLLNSLDSPNMESFLEKKTDARSDVYSLGATLYQLLTRLSPEKATSTIRAHAIWSGKSDTLEPVQNWNPDVSDDLAQIIHCSLEIEPEKRFQTAAEFHQALNDLQNAYLTTETPGLPETRSDFTGNKAVPPTGNFSTDKSADPNLSVLTFAGNAKKTPAHKSKIILLIAGLMIFILLAGSGIYLAWKFAKTPVATAPRVLNYSLRVQKIRDGKEYQEPFDSSGQEIFENGYKFQMRFTPPENGFFYVFAEGLNGNGDKVFNIIFPTPLKNDGKAVVTANQTYETGWNKFGGTAGTENFWMIWSKNKPEIAEKARENAFLSAGELTNKNLANELGKYLQANNTTNASVSKDSGNKLTRVEFNGDSIAYLIELEHR